MAARYAPQYRIEEDDDEDDEPAPKTANTPQKLASGEDDDSDMAQASGVCCCCFGSCLTSCLYEVGILKPHIVLEKPAKKRGWWGREEPEDWKQRLLSRFGMRS